MNNFSSMSRSILCALFLLSSCAACAGGGDALAQPTPTPTPPTRAEGDAPSRRVIEAHVTRLASEEWRGRDEGSPGGVAARAYIVDALRGCGVEPLTPGFTQTIEGGEGANVLGVIRGTDAELRSRHVLVGAHYDHLGECVGGLCKGADDNAAAVAILLDVACSLASKPGRRSVVIAAWDAEEPPTFLTPQMGSRFYVEHPAVPLEQTDAALILDLVGSDLWPGYEEHFVLGAELSPTLRAAVIATPPPAPLVVRRLGLHLAEETAYGHQAWSDYDAFRDREVPVLFFTNGQNKRYHTPDDDVARLNLPKMVLEAGYLLALVERLAGADETPTFEREGRDDLGDVENGLALLDAALAKGGLIDALGLSVGSRLRLSGHRDVLRDLKAKLDAGAKTLSDDEVVAVRLAAQRLICLAGNYVGEVGCLVGF